MVSFKKGFYATSSEQERKPEALSSTTSLLQLFQPSLLRTKTRFITQALRLHRAKFTDRMDMKQQNAQQKKNENISMIGWTSLKEEAQIRKKLNGKKVKNLSNIQLKNEQLISANISEDQMVRFYQNIYDDLSDMVRNLFQPLSEKY